MFNFLNKTLYVRLKSDWLSVRALFAHQQPYEYENIPCLAIKGSMPFSGFSDLKISQILAVGQEAIQIHQHQNSITSLLNGFEHPRTIISNFYIAELTLKYFIKKAYQQRNSFISPRIIIHPLEKLEGGLTQIETRALFELGSQVGGREVYIYLDQNPLSDEEVLKIHTNQKVIKESTSLKR